MAKAKKKKTAMPAVKKRGAKKKKSARSQKPTGKKNAAKKSSPAKKLARKSVAKPVKAAEAKKSSGGRSAPKDYSGFVTPLDDRVLVRLTEAERKTSGGLYIPDTVADVSGNLEGRVVAIGRGHRGKKGRLRPMDVGLGDRVVFAQYAGSKIKILDEELVLLRESEVMGVLS